MMRTRIIFLASALGILFACDSGTINLAGNDSGSNTNDGGGSLGDGGGEISDGGGNGADANCSVSIVTPPPITCSPVPASADADAIATWTTTNTLRSGMGIPCQNQIETINTAAELHCLYYASNSGSCTSNSHVEVDGCNNYVAASFSTRMSLAGYTGQPAFENMAFANNGSFATQQWVDSVWHRTPILSPWIGEHGYGNAAGCDTMDFGRGGQAANDMMVTYPFNGQGEVPTSFSGNEGPRPPAPPQGFPSGYPIHLYARSATVSTHVLRKKCDATEIPHVWITPADNALLRDEFVMYANTPLESGTAYVIEFSGMHQGQAFNHQSEFVTR